MDSSPSSDANTTDAKQDSQAPASAAPSARGLGGFSALKIRNYRYYAVSGIFQQGALHMEIVTNGYFAYQLSGSKTVLGVALLAQAIPQTLLSFVGGVLSDRVPRRTVMMVCFTLCALLSLWIGISAQRGEASWQELVIRFFFFGCIVAFQMPARQGLIGELVGRDKIMSGVGINQAIMNVMQLSGPAIAGFTIHFVGVYGAYYLISGMFVMAMVSLLPIKYQPRKMLHKAGVKAFLSSASEGFRYAKSNKDVTAVLTASLLTVFLAMPYTVLLPVMAEDVLKVGPGRLGLLASFTGIGALIGALGLTVLTPRKRGVFFIYSMLFISCGLLVFSISHSYALSCVVVLFIGIGSSIRNTLSNALIQTYTEDAYIGRVLSIMVMQVGLSSIGAFLIAVLAQVIGVQWALGISSVLLITLAISYLLFSRRLRRMA